jgi:ankyrin repeat protein
MMMDAETETAVALGKRLLSHLMCTIDLDKCMCTTQEEHEDEVKGNAMQLLNAYPHPLVDVNVNITEARRGWTPLLVALDRGFLDIAAILISRGADVNRARDNGRYRRLP